MIVTPTFPPLRLHFLTDHECNPPLPPPPPTPPPATPPTGEGLEEDEEAAYAALLPRPLRDLPGGGLGHGAILTVQDQSQHWGVDVIIAHTVGRRGGGEGREQGGRGGSMIRERSPIVSKVRGVASPPPFFT